MFFCLCSLAVVGASVGILVGSSSMHIVDGVVGVIAACLSLSCVARIADQRYTSGAFLGGDAGLAMVQSLVLTALLWLVLVAAPFKTLLIDLDIRDVYGMKTVAEVAKTLRASPGA